MTDAERNLALARAMQLEREFYPHEIADFDPIESGADFDAVLMWARKHDDAWAEVLTIMLERDCSGCSDTEFRRAVVDAIVLGAGGSVRVV